jgi:hypothetical protein
MKTIAVFCNIVLFLFTCFVLLTDGLPTQIIYTIFTIWALFTMIFSAVVIAQTGTVSPSRIKTIEIFAIICNIIFLIFVIWAFIDQYPHPAETGFIEFSILMILTPLISLTALFIDRFKSKQLETQGQSRLSYK